MRAAGGVQELHAKDTTNTGTNLGDAVTPFLLNGLQRGTTIDSRVGRRIHMTSLLFTFQIYPGDSQTEDQDIKIFIVYDRQSNANAPTNAQVYANLPGATAPTSPRNLAHMDRFKVIYSKILRVKSSADDKTTISRKKYFRLNLPTVYNSGSTGNIGDISAGSLYFMAIGDTTLTSNNVPKMDFNCRIRFRDC